MAGEEWGAPMERIPVPEARAGSWEDVFPPAGAEDKLPLMEGPDGGGEARGGGWEDVCHQAGAEDKLLLMEGLDEVEGALDARGHRAIGVVYRPEAERFGNYVPTVLPYRYD